MFDTYRAGETVEQPFPGLTRAEIEERLAFFRAAIAADQAER